MNVEEYRNQYELSGYEFVLTDTFVLIREQGMSSYVNKSAYLCRQP